MTAEERYMQSTGIIGFALKKFFYRFRFDEDVNAEAQKALWIACLKYDEQKGSKFSPFAVQYIRGYVGRYLNNYNVHNVPEVQITPKMERTYLSEKNSKKLDDCIFLESIPDNMRSAAEQILHPETATMTKKELEEAKERLRDYFETR